jgi:hypothetical protein
VQHQRDSRDLLRVLAGGIRHRRGRSARRVLTRGGEGRSALAEGSLGARCRATGVSVGGVARR